MMPDGEDLRLIRHGRRLTQRELAAMARIPQSRISAIENGLKMKPKEAKAILRALAHNKG